MLEKNVTVKEQSRKTYIITQSGTYWQNRNYKVINLEVSTSINNRDILEFPLIRCDQ